MELSINTSRRANLSKLSKRRLIELVDRLETDLLERSELITIARELL